MSRSEMRELAFKFMYGAEIQKEINIEDIDSFLELNEAENIETKEYIEILAKGILENDEDITNTIKNNLKSDWSIERISKTSLALLKIAIYEIKYQNLPFKAIINEVVNLAKKYSDETSAIFINGVLASIVN